MRFFRRSLFLIAWAISAAVAQADPYPSKPVKVVVGFPPGQATDLVARALSSELSRKLGQSFYVENKPGVGASLSAEFVARAPADGYTIAVTSSGPLAVNPWLYKSVRYDAVRDFEPLAFIGKYPLVMIVNNKSSRFMTIGSLVTAARESPGGLTFASNGKGATNHLVMEMFKRRADVDLLHVPYSGTMAGLNDLLGGNVDVMLDTVASLEPFAKQGKVRAMAIASDQRAAGLPDIPTIAESGFQGFSGEPWIGVFGPRKMPQPVIEKLSAAVADILADPEFVKKLRATGAVPQQMTRTEFAEFVKA